MREVDKTLTALLRDQGLKVSSGVISTGLMPTDAVSLGVILVANAARDVASWLYDNSRIKRTRDFRTLLAAFLEDKFNDHVSHNAVILGSSHKSHRFANVISLPNGRRLIIDPVINDASSINARVVANLDVKAKNDPLIEQRIVYDDEDDWSAADLNLLNVGATVIPFTRAPEVIQRIAQAV